MKYKKRIILLLVVLTLGLIKVMFEDDSVRTGFIGFCLGFFTATAYLTRRM